MNPRQNSQSLNTTHIWRPNALHQAQGIYLSAWSEISDALSSAVQASAMLSMFISLQILKMNFSETATTVFITGIDHQRSGTH